MTPNNVSAAFLAFIAFLFLPLSLFSPKSPALLLGLAAVAALPSAVGAVRRRVARLPWGPLAAVGLLLGWALVSAAWAPDTGSALGLTGRVLALAGAAGVLSSGVRGLTGDQVRRVGSALLAGFSVALAVLAVEYFFGTPLLTLLADLGVYDAIRRERYNPGATLLAVALWPLAFMLWRTRGPVAAGALGLAAVLVLTRSEAFAATLALGAGAAAAGLAALGRPPVRVLAVAVPCLVLAGPFVVEAVGAPGEAGGLLSADLSAPVAVRLHIWSFAADLIREAPVLGWGMDASRDIPGGHALIPGFGTQEYLPLHPHNGTLQVWLELGAVGALGAAVFLGLVLWRIGGLAARGPRAAGLGMAAAILVMANMSYGLWQNWWLAGVALLWGGMEVARQVVSAEAPSHINLR